MKKFLATLAFCAAPQVWAATVVQDWDTAVYPVGNTDVRYGIGTNNLRLQFAGPLSGGRPTEGGTYNTSGGSHTVGGGGNSIITGKNAGAAAIVSTITLTTAVTAVSFNIFDVDNADRVTVTASNGGAAVAVTLTRVDMGTVTKTFTLAGNVATGTGANSGGNSVAGTLGVDIAGPVDRIVISGTTTNGGGETFLYALSDIRMVTANPPAIACPDPLQRLDWDVVGYTAGSLNQTFTVTDIAPFPNVDFRFTYTGNSADFIAAKPGLVNYANTGSVGGGGMMLDLFHDPEPDTDSQLVTLIIDIFEAGTTTPLQLTDVRFSVNDVDSNVTGNDFIDMVTVTASAGGTGVAPTLEAEGNGAATELHGNTFSMVGNTATAQGFDDGTDNDPRSSVNFYFASAVDRIVVNYDDAGPDDGSFDSSRAVKFSDIVFCPPSSVPVTLNYFATSVTGQGIEADWQTASEISHAGFQVLQSDGSDWIVMNGGQVGSAGLSMAPQNYATTVWSNDGAIPDSLVLESLDTDGSRQRFGPFKVGVAYGEQVIAKTIPWAGIRKAMDAQMVRAKSVADRADIAVIDGGLQRVSHSDLLAAGVDLSGADPATIAVSFRGEAVARHILVGNPATGFAPGDTIDFFALEPTGEDAIYLNAYLYRIAIDPGLVWAATSVPGPARQPFVTDYRHTERIENDIGYDFAIPTDDPWYDQRLLAFGGAANTSVQLPVSALETGPAQLSLELVGGVDFDEPGPDHHVTVSLNGASLINAFNDGLIAWNLTTPVTASALIEGNNTVAIAVPGDTGFLFDIVYVDAYTLTYQRALTALNDRLAFDGAADGFSLTGFSAPNLVAYAQTAVGDLYALGTQETLDGSSYTAVIPGAGVDGNDLFSNGFEADGSGSPAAVIPAHYWVSTPAAVYRPNVTAAATGSIAVAASTNYLILAHPVFIGAALQNYAASRQPEGFNAQIIDVQDIYAQYSHGMALPSAIQDFLRAAVASAPITHVLLVGGDSFDYRDFTGQGSISFVPTRYARTNDIIYFSPSDGLLTDLNGDEVPDLAVGRWPVRTTVELQAMIDKTADFAISGLADARSAVLVAGLHDPGAPSFAGQAERAAEFLVSPGGGAPWSSIDRVYLDDIAAMVAPGNVIPTGRQQLIDAINAGRTLTMFSGHGAPTMWTFQGLMTPAIAGSLANVGLPTLITTFTCWTTYFVNPRVDTLAHQLLNAGDRGAVAVHGAVTLSAYGDNEALATSVLNGMIDEGMTLGEAILAGKQQLAALGNRYRDVIINWALLGDPTLTINP